MKNSEAVASSLLLLLGVAGRAAQVAAAAWTCSFTLAVSQKCVWLSSRLFEKRKPTHTRYFFEVVRVQKRREA